MGKASRKKKAASEPSLSAREGLGLPETVGSFSQYHSLIHLLLIAVIGLISYSNTFNGSFHFDDNTFIVNNPVIKDLSFFLEPSRAKGLGAHFSFGIKERYIGFLTLALNYRLGGFDVTGYHIFNLTVHLINALLVYLLTVTIFSTPFLRVSSPKARPDLVALFAALLFVCHPVQTQAVTYTWQRITSLATMFYLTALVLYLKWRTSDPRSSKPLVFYAASFVSAVLAMKTKEISITLPIVLLLCEFMFFDEKLKKRILLLVPFLLTMFIVPLTLLHLDRPVGEMMGQVSHKARALTNMQRTDYLFTEWRVIVTYLRLLIFPVRQTVDYDYPTYNSFLKPQVYLSFLFLTSIIATGIYIFCRSGRSAPRTRLISFGIFWFFIALSVESSFIPIKEVIAEHRVYLPSVGVFIALTTFLFSIKDNSAHKGMKIGKALIPGLALVVAVLAIATHTRNKVWQDEVIFWSDVVEKSPLKAGGHNNLGNAYYLRGRTDKAIEQYEIASKLDPDHAEAHNNLGNAYNSKGWTDKAIEQYEIALRLDPNNTGARNNLGNAYNRKGWTDKAIQQYKAALALKPNDARAHFNLGITYAKNGFKHNAEEELKEALRIDPDFISARKALESLTK